MKKVVLNYLVIATLAVSAAFIISCSKSVSDEDFGEVQLPKTIVTKSFRDYHRHEYEYDSQNRIIKYLSYFSHEELGPDAVPRTVKTFTYIEDYFVKVVVERLNSSTSTVEISKNGNRATATRKYIGGFYDGEISFTAITNLDKNGYPTKRESAFVPGAFGANHSEVETYQFRNGNLIRHSIVRSYGPNTDDSFTYDNKKSPFFYCETPIWVTLNLFMYYYFSKNNYTGFKYEYNTAGLPVKRTMKLASGEEYVIEYIYK